MFENIGEIITRASREGYHWFAPSSLNWWNTRLEIELYGGRFFVTSERQELTDEYPARWTVREAYEDEKGKLSIRAVGEFQQYGTRHAAHKAAKALADGLGTNEGTNDVE